MPKYLLVIEYIFIGISVTAAVVSLGLLAGYIVGLFPISKEKGG